MQIIILNKNFLFATKISSCPYDFIVAQLFFQIYKQQNPKKRTEKIKISLADSITNTKMIFGQSELKVGLGLVYFENVRRSYKNLLKQYI